MENESKRAAYTSVSKAPTKRLRQDETRTRPKNSQRKTLSASDHMTTNDEMHKTIKFEPVCKAFIDTPHFQRLRYLKQLATSDLTYMCSGHSRFEHSCGVAHLAEKVLKNILEAQPQLECSRKDILCVKLAGLLHDIGHGPFSHVFERFILKRLPKHMKTLSEEERALYNDFEPVPKGFGHEQISLKLIDSALAHLGLQIDLQNLDKPLQEIGDVGIQADSFRSFVDGEILTSRDLVFVKELIAGKPIPEICKETIHGFVGRPKWQSEWMYDVVANRHSGFDVDKVDYFCRDARRCFGESQVDEVMIRDPVVAWGDCTTKSGCELCSGAISRRPFLGKHLMLCFPQKRVEAVIEFFNKRFTLHTTVYWHKTTVAASQLVMDIFCEADPFYRVSTSAKTNAPDRQKKEVPELPISRAMMDDQAYLRLKDSLIESIANTQDKRLEPARRLADRYLNRDLYKCAGEVLIDAHDPRDLDLWTTSEDEILQSLVRMRGKHCSPHSGTVTLSSADVIVDKFSMHHGLKERNPIENIRVVPGCSMSGLTKNAEILPLAEPVNIGKYKAQTPVVQEQKCIRVFCRGNEEKCELLSHVFQTWLDDARAEVEQSSGSGQLFHPISQSATPKNEGQNEEYVDVDNDAPAMELPLLDETSEAVCVVSPNKPPRK